jgi:Putative Actinobacterial Holin-X, holin superfamily III
MTADWTTQAADAIERAVSVVRDKTVVPAQKATRAVVFGLLASFFLGTALTVLTIGVFRGLVILTGDAWIAYLICGGILVLGGAFCWRLRLKKPPKDKPSKDG